MKFIESMFQHIYELLTIKHALRFSASPSMKLTDWPTLAAESLFRSQSFLSRSWNMSILWTQIYNYRLQKILPLTTTLILPPVLFI